MRSGGRKVKSKAALPTHNAGKSTTATTGNPARSFPLSPYMVLMSLLFWMCIAYLSFKGFQYLAVHRTINDDDLDGFCDAVFSKTLEENVKFVNMYPKGEAGPYIGRIGSQKYKDTFQGEEAPKELSKIPPIVTAVTSDDFWIIQGLIKQVVEGNAKGMNLQLVVFDIGLYASELVLLKKHCQCDVRKFDANVYPLHVADFTNKAYRPIIIQLMLEEFGSAIWIDPDVRLQTVSDLTMLKYRGARNFFLWETSVFTGLTSYTSPDMFKFLDERRCAFLDFGMMDTKTMVFYRTNQTWKGVMEPWLKCVLNKDCLTPPNARNSECFHYRRPKWTGCHWYDQSAFSIIVNRVFQFSTHPDQYSVPRFTWHIDVDVVYYFPEQPWTYKQLAALMLSPFICCGVFWFLYSKRKRAADPLLPNKSYYNKR
ncbi:uncharacterized protein LOC110460707 [Mizuhopecten yessoensis]|uniref:Uncharacterized protein n=1 Tax=Mizuhopecten yessoensis TaxID=6573 RepID=A0A210R2X0_MIZYE|nr:uncharacterized protein LOC110460707 [Mizuhopecten yessoensis]OWF55359.1 hypothetical protein KP79_PYT21731 [Mizuhopecten yessoensis]